MNRPDHLFVSSSDGGLYDTRKLDWSKLPPLRPVYSQFNRTIKNGAQLRSNLRALHCGYGGYEVLFLADDGATLCGKCVRENLHSVIDSIRTKTNDGWRVVAAFGSDQCGPGDYCENCNRIVDPFYDETDNEGESAS